VISGCLASLGGAYLTLVQVRFFAEGMSAGKGFIAIAALIFGRWHPIGSALASLLFGATEALQLRIQVLGDLLIRSAIIFGTEVIENLHFDPGNSIFLQKIRS
jgi:ABC-type uncharacterized transport system permease subunit